MLNIGLLFVLYRCMHQLILASQSPRRRQLLEEAGFVFRVESVKVSEIIDKNLNLDDALKALARTKAEALVSANKSWKGQNILVLAADTVVVLDGEVLGKPANAAEAAQFLRRLSGKTHCVKTALCFWDAAVNAFLTAVDTTDVEFLDLSDGEIAAYVAGGEPMDKAGAYGIQGEGGRFVRRISGSWTNVVGLPLELVREVINKNGWHIDRREPGANQ